MITKISPTNIHNPTRPQPISKWGQNSPVIKPAKYAKWAQISTIGGAGSGSRSQPSVE